MAKVTNAFSTYLQKGIREDLADIISNIDPSDTPLMSMIGSRKVTQPTFEWQTESLPSLDTSNKRIEGDDVTRTAGTPTVRVGNVCQISTRNATVTGTMSAVEAAGRSDEMAHQMALIGKALKRDMEAIASQNQARNNGSDNGAGTETARATRGLEHWIVTNGSRGATGAAAVSETAAVTDGTQRALSESLFKTVMQGAYDNGAEPTVMILGSVNKMNVHTFAGRTQSQQIVDPNAVNYKTTLLMTDFGTVKAIASRWVRTRTALLIDPEYVKIAYLRKFQSVDLATTGDATSKMILSEWGVQCDNEKAHTIIADLNTTIQ